MKFCEAAAGKIGRHVIVEFQRDLKFYSPEQLADAMRNYRNAGE
jgi:hypothetical protein